MPEGSSVPFRVVLLDIEGTTTSISFVYDVLFPYARQALGQYLEKHWEKEGLKGDVRDLIRQHAEDLEAGTQPPDWTGDPSSASTYLKWLMDQDRKSTPLKSIQGKIWQDGYERGLLQGHLYPDVAPALQRLTKDGKEVCIFSSGSVLAQKLLFGNTTEGDIRPLISAYFDTRTGPKMEVQSYLEISRQLGHAPSKILFVSDVVAELDPATAAGMQTRLCVRPGNKPQPASNHRVIRSLEELG